MAFTTTTVLGRRVAIEDWRGFHRDRLLMTLYQMRTAGGDDNGITYEQIASVTGLDGMLVLELVQSMKAKPKLISLRVVPHPVTVVITARGVRWVEESPCLP